jgi:ATP-dependent RNA helicase DeaD
MSADHFSELGLSTPILQAIQDMGFEEPSPIQSLAIPMLLEGRDVIGQAQTGTGKTVAFGIPVLEKIDDSVKAIQSIIICPTRELAIQVAEELHTLAKYRRGINVLPVYGGQPIDRQFRALRQGVQVVVGTPGRVMDHLQRGTIRLDQVRVVVLDEADEMLDMGFREDIEAILKNAPDQRQTVLFSATMPPEILRLADTYLMDRLLAKVSPKVLTVPNVEQLFYEVPRGLRLEAMCRIIDVYNPKLSIVFSNTKRGVDQIVEHLQARGYLSEGLHGDMNQNQRDRVMGKFRAGNVEILVATDVAARGIDVDDVEAVFNFDIPSDVEYYVHRIGRTGRAGRAGRAVTFASGREFYKLRDIQRFTKSKMIQRGVPSVGDVEQAKTEKFLSQIQEVMNQGDLHKYQRTVEQFLEKEQVASLDMAAALLKMLMGPAREGQADILPTRDFSSDSFQDRRPSSRSSDSGSKRFQDRFQDQGPQQGMTRLQLNVGREHSVEVRDVVGAIAGETGLSGRQIGKILLRDRQCFVEVPAEFADEVLRIMNGNQIRGLNIQVQTASQSGDSGPGAHSARPRPTSARPFRTKKPGPGWKRNE